MNKLFDTAKKFKIEGEINSCVKYGEGHINDTFLLKTDKNKYILQKINNKIFTDVKGLMSNIVGVTEYIRAKLVKENKNPDRYALTVVKTTDNKSFLVTDDDEYYRTYIFIDNAESLQIPETAEQFAISGVGFGQFQKYLDGYPAETLTEPIKNFHNTRDRFEKLKQAISDNVAGRLSLCQAEVNAYLQREQYSDKVLELLTNGEMPYRVTHNDTKLNNVLIDTTTNTPVAVLDLDTVMPGSILYDFGDSIRFGANTGAEDEKDLSKVTFSIEYFEAYTKGFVAEVSDKLVKAEIDNLAFGAILMTYECGMRFLTDYLNGDTYFKVHRENHNLDRTRTQLKMIVEMEKNLDKMNEIVKKYI